MQLVKRLLERSRKKELVVMVMMLVVSGNLGKEGING